jgi:Protein of unknown function (DUF3467)
MADDPKMPPAPMSEAAAGAAGQMPQFAMDSASLSTVYTNFCHVTFTPEELILDFGLNTQTPPSPTQPIKLTHRVVMNFYTAKRLMNGLHFAVSRFESLFGPLELDFQKRMRPMPGTGGRPPSGPSTL